MKSLIKPRIWFPFYYITKSRLIKYIENSTNKKKKKKKKKKKENFQIKNSYIFFSYFCSKHRLYSYKPEFYCIEMGFKGRKTI